MTIYTIIVTYNGHRWMDFCLGSLRKSSIKTIPLIIDNGSTDDTIPYIRIQYPEVILFPQERNLGFGQANNIGLRYALAHNADYVLLLNQDAAIASNAIELMLAQSDEKSLLSPIHMNGDGTKVDFSFRENTLYHCPNLINDAFANNIKPYYFSSEICAACWLLPISIVKQIGGFNPIFFHYCEDNNYYHRLVYHNISCRLVPAARMYHDRKEFGNEQVYRKQWLWGCMLLNATNINFTRRERFLEQLGLLWKCYRYRLGEGHYHIGSFLWHLCRLSVHLSTVRHSRKIEKQKKATWL